MIAQVLLAFALVLIVIGSIMILLDAFSESVVWGILVLLLAPIFGPFFAFVHWYKARARNGFALSFFGMVLLVVGIYGGGINAIPGLADQEVVKNLPIATPSNEPLSNEEAAASIELDEEEDGEYDPILSSDKERFSVDEIEPLAPAGDKTLRGNARAKVKKVLLQGDDIYSSVGRNVKVTFTDGSSKSGKLIANAEDSISLEQHVGGGSVSFEHKLNTVRSISLLVDPSAAPLPPTVKKKEVEAEVELAPVSKAPEAKELSSEPSIEPIAK